MTTEEQIKSLKIITFYKKINPKEKIIVYDDDLTRIDTLTRILATLGIGVNIDDF